MKTSIITLVITISSISLFSCKKDRVCTCTYSDGTVYSKTTFTKVTKKEAKTYCTTSLTGVTCSVQ